MSDHMEMAINQFNAWCESKKIKFLSDKAQPMQMCLAEWLSSSVFPNPGSMEVGSACSKVSEHMPCHGVESLSQCSRLKHLSDVLKVCFVPGGKCQQKVSEDLLDDVKGIEV